MPQISIIVPVYKVEKYLDKCVKSILAQTFKDFELILVDDGSPDNCGKMCDDYAKQDDRIVVLHKENGGLSDARNAGIDIAKGQYLGFVDSDDYIAPDMYEVLYKNLVENDADLSCCSLYDCYLDKIVPRYKNKKLITLDKYNAIKMVLEDKLITASAWNKLYKKYLFDNIKYPVGKLSEDAFVILKILAKATKIVVTTDCKYYYLRRKDSITGANFNKRDFDVIEAYSENFKFIKTEIPKLKKQAEFKYFWAYQYVLDKIILSSNFDYNEDYFKIVKYLKKNIIKILLNPIFTIYRKLMFIILFFSKNSYNYIIKRHYRRNLW